MSSPLAHRCRRCHVTQCQTCLSGARFFRYGEGVHDLEDAPALYALGVKADIRRKGEVS